MFQFTVLDPSKGHALFIQWQCYCRLTQTDLTGTKAIIFQYAYDDANRLIDAGETTHFWDDNGNLIDDGARAYTYNQANQLIALEDDGLSIVYRYNGDGARLQQIVNDAPTTYVLDLAAPLPVVLQSQAGESMMQYVYALGTRPLAQSSGTWEYLLADALGSVRQIVDLDGNVTLAESYEPYGTVLTSNGTASSVFGYSGEEVDTSGLVFLRARYLNPQIGIFLAHDPWNGDAMRPGSMNGYSYVEGNPVTRVDPRGEYPYTGLNANCEQLGWSDTIVIDTGATGIWGDLLKFRTGPKSLYCEPIVHGDFDATVNLLVWLARAMPVFGMPHGEKNLDHYIWGDRSPKIHSSQWYLENTPYNESWRTLLDLQLLQHQKLNGATGFCQLSSVVEKRLFDSDKDVKVTVGRHFVYASFVQPNDPLWQNSCDCEKIFYIQYWIDDRFDFDPQDPADGTSPQIVSIPYREVHGIGNIPFEWLHDLEVLNRVHVFNWTLAKIIPRESALTRQ